MLLFRDEEHLGRWCRARDLSPGATLTPDQAWRLARAWYGDKVRDDWRRHTREETVALFEECGLRGEFWNLG